MCYQTTTYSISESLGRLQVQVAREALESLEVSLVARVPEAILTAVHSDLGLGAGRTVR